MPHSKPWNLWLMSHHLHDYVTLTLWQGLGGEGQVLIRALRSRGFFQPVASGDLKHKGKSVRCSWLRGGGARGRNVGAVGAERGLSGWQLARKQGPQAYNCKEMNSANDLNDLGSSFLCERGRAWTQINGPSPHHSIQLVTDLCSEVWKLKFLPKFL